MSLNSNAVITLENLKVYLHISEDTYDSLLEKLINAVSEDLETRFGWSLIYTSYSSSKLDGDGRKDFYLPGRPVWAVSALTEGDDTLVEDTDYVIKETGSHRSYLRKILSGETYDNDLVWAKGINNIVISYTAGWWVEGDPAAADGATEMPEDIQMGVAMQVGLLKKRFDAEDWDVSSQAFPDGSISKNIIELHPFYKEIINKYRRVLL